MKAEEKAKELFVKFNYKTSQINGNPMAEWKCAKECALICVNEILSEKVGLSAYLYEYWKEVKEHIKQL